MPLRKLTQGPLLAALLAALACSSADQTEGAAPGAEGGECVGGDLCDWGLECVGGVCEPGPGGRDTAGWPTSSGATAAATSGSAGDTAGGGGSTSTDGGSGTGTATGGAAATGGSTSTGGTATSGGATSTGGVNTGGGAQATGGSGAQPGGTGGAGAGGTPGGTGGSVGVDAGVVCTTLPKIAGSCPPRGCLCDADSLCYESTAAVSCCGGSCN